MQELDAVYGGWRYPVDAQVDDRTFCKFHVDVGVGDAVVSEPEWKEGLKILDFAGIPPARIALLPIEQQFAEKLHAYTLPRRGKLNSRVRDLVDLVLLIEQGLPKISKIVLAVNATFSKRKSHPLPDKLEVPPKEWEKSYQQMAEEIGLSKNKTDQAFSVVQKY